MVTNLHLKYTSFLCSVQILTLESTCYWASEAREHRADDWRYWLASGTGRT